MPNLGGLLSRIGRGAVEARNTLMPSPTGLQGLLSDEDVSNARSQGMIGMGVGLLNSRGGSPLADGITGGQGAYQKALGSAVDMNEAGRAYSTEQNMLQKKAAIAQAYPVSPDMSASQMREVYMAYMQAGIPIPTGLSEIIKSMDQGNGFTHVDKGDRIGFYDKSGKLIKEEKKGATPGSDAAGERAERREQVAQTRQGQAISNQVIDDFNRETADFHKAYAGYEVLKGARNAPGFLSPMAALDAFARVINPGAAVRIGTMQMLKQQGSFGDKTERYLQMAMNGQWPEGMMNSIQSIVDGIMQEHYETFNDARARSVARAQAAGVDVSPYLFTPKAISGGAAKPGAAKPSGSRIRGIK